MWREHNCPPSVQVEVVTGVDLLIVYSDKNAIKKKNAIVIMLLADSIKLCLTPDP